MAKHKVQQTQTPLIIAAGPSRIAAPVLPVIKWLSSGVEAGCISSNVVSASYDAKLRILYVTFLGYKMKPNVRYFYYGVPPVLARDFYHASSLGLFVQRRLEPFYYYQKV